MYETEGHLAVERSIAEKVEKAWNCTVNKMPIRLHLDYVIQRGDKAVAFCEIKTRGKTMQEVDDLGGYLIDVNKLVAAKGLYDVTGLPFVLVVGMNDGIWYTKMTEFKPDDVLVRGRKDRGDWQDVAPCGLLLSSRFKRLDV